MTRLRDTNTGACLHTLSGHEGGVHSVVYSPRGDVLASASSDKTVKLWDVETGECRQSFSYYNRVMVVAYSPQGDQVASGDYAGSVKLWDVRTGECRFELYEHNYEVTGIVYSPNGGQIVTGGVDATARLWDVTSGEFLVAIETINSAVTSIAWGTTPDINYFVIGCDDGSVQMWRVVVEDEDEGFGGVRLYWGSVKGELIVKDTSIQGVRGLSLANEQLLRQRGAVGEPSDRLRAVGKKVITMGSVVSALKKTPNPVVRDPASSNLSV